MFRPMRFLLQALGVSDSRHVHFTYNQSVGGAGELILDFPGYLTQNIDFQTYYNGGVFDWSGTIAVGGTNQVLRIHTHATSGFSADFFYNKRCAV